ncbi:Protein CBG16770 [Caenorhabditis briggsae]|uniref:Protein CBG16770 n=1 Tax=Caenorhabditis briggsae TaxID=6238 RepID=A8XPS4_CAEBR|nr:Protein CBG16770 [Caenorhabditis briggsae]CAP34650.1 Protein CBG16770 [Caenorhabditis briggsae]
MVNQAPKAQKSTQNQETQNIKNTIKKFHANVQPILHSSYKANQAKVVRVKKCWDENCDCSTEDCDNVCDRKVCPKSCTLKKAGCRNQVFEEYRLKDKLFYAESSGEKGIGLFASRDIKKYDFIVPYNGEIITAAELEIRKKKYKEIGVIHTYPFKAGRGFYIDPTERGNSARFANHSCDPNMIAQKYVVNNRKEGFRAIGYIADRDIEKHSELTINYGYDYDPVLSQRCLCGAEACKGWIGQPPPPADAKDDEHPNDEEVESLLDEDEERRIDDDDEPLVDEEDENIPTKLNNSKSNNYSELMPVMNSLEQRELSNVYKKILEIPVRAQLKNGLISELQFEKEDTEWSENMKRAILNTISFNPSAPRDEKLESDEDKEWTENNTAFFTNEKTLEGNCQVA